MNAARLSMLSLMLLAVATGCDSGKNKGVAQDDQNKNLQNKLGQCETALHAAQGDRDTLMARLNEAGRELESLRAQLASAPTPAEAAPGWTPVPGGAMITIEDDILFEPGKAVLKDKTRGKLEGIVSTLQGEYGNKDVLVFGHTDSQPIKKSGWTDNYELSAQRSLAVTRYLKDHGVTPKRLIACGAGEHRPRASNSGDQGRQSNRRVEIYAIDLAALKH